MKVKLKTIALAAVLAVAGVAQAEVTMTETVLFDARDPALISGAEMAAILAAGGIVRPAAGGGTEIIIPGIEITDRNATGGLVTTGTGAQPAFAGLWALTALNSDAVDIGSRALASDTSVAVGQLATATGGSVAAGPSATATFGSVAAGGSATATGGSVAAGPGATATGGAVAVGGASISDARGVAIGVSSSSGMSGVAIGAEAISSSAGVAIGPNAAAGTGGVAVGSNAVAADGEVSVGNASSGETRRIANVADGVLPSDAATVRQVQATHQALGALDQRVSSQISALDQRIGSVRREALSGIAAATALSQPLQFAPGAKNAMAVGVGTYGGYGAVAIGYGRRLNEKSFFSAGVSFTSAGDAAARAGMSWSW